MIAVWIIAASVILLSAVSFGSFWIAFVRYCRVDPSGQKKILDQATTPFLPQIKAARACWDAAPFEELWIRAEDGVKLYGRLYRHPAAERTVVLFHGYRSSGQNDFVCGMGFYYDELKCNLLVIDQRAHGRSGGMLITFGIKERQDCLSWAREAAKHSKGMPIYLAGISMGAASVLMASDLPFPASVKGLIADCGYTCPKEILEKVIRTDMHLPAKPFLGMLQVWFRLMAGARLDAANGTRALQRSALPVFFAHGTGDSFVPYTMSQNNYNACPSSHKRLLLVEGAAHGMSFMMDQKRYTEELKAFIAQAETI